MRPQPGILCLSALVGLAGVVHAEDAANVQEIFTKGTFNGALKSYYYAQTFEGTGKHDSQIWVNGGLLAFSTGRFHGVTLGTELQASSVGYKDDEDGVTAGSMDADGFVLSEAYLQYDLFKTSFKGGRQHYVSPLVANSGSRLIKESFEMYTLKNIDIPGTEVTAGWVDKYQTRTDKSSYSDNAFVDYDTNGSGQPGGFYDVGDDGMWVVYIKNSSVKNLAVQAQYADVVGEVQGFYLDGQYTFDVDFKPYVGAQLYYTDWDDWDTSGDDTNELFGLTTGANLAGVDIFAGYTTAGGDAGDARVFRGLGQGAYYNYTTTTKTAGASAFDAGTDAYQLGAGYKYADFSGKFRFTNFDTVTPGNDLNEYTLNLAYSFTGMLKNLRAEIDFSVLDYENDQKDATDLRTRLIYTF